MVASKYLYSDDVEYRTRTKSPPSQKWIKEIDPLYCPIHAFMLFLDELAQKTDILKVLLRLVEALYAVLLFESSKSGPKDWFSE